MGIQLTKIRISNFRSIDYLETNLDNLNVIIGQNNAGKSNVLRAVTLALSSNPYVSERDIRIEKGEDLSPTKQAIIDIMLQPVDESGKLADSFSPFWISTFTTEWISTDIDDNSFVGIRTIIKYDLGFGQYAVEKQPIFQWNDSVSSANCSRRKPFSQDMRSYISCFYLDAHRDITEDIKNKNSYFGRATSSKDLSDELVKEIEADLNAINSKIVENTPALSSTQNRIAKVGSVIGKGTEVQIEPISRKISDLHRGMDIKLCDAESAALSISEQGMGTRSWVSFLTLGAYIVNINNQIRRQDPDSEMFVFLALEEPEAHLHTHAQKRLFNQILNFPGQKIISTHSSGILAHVPIASIIHLYRHNAKTNIHRLKKEHYSTEQLAVIQREVIRSRGDLLFSSAVIFAEGITEEIALPVFFKEYFAQESFSSGVSIVGIDGQCYKAFLQLVRDFEIPWFIFSDAEESTVATVKKAVEEVYGKDCDELNNIVFLDSGDNYEKSLIRDGYAELMIDAINEYEKVIRDELFPEDAKRDPGDFFDKFVSKHNHEKISSQKTGETCQTCGQPLRRDVLRDYDGEDGRLRALLDVFKKKNGKAKYTLPIAQAIVKHDGKKVPTKVAELFSIMDSKLHIKEEVSEND